MTDKEIIEGNKLIAEFEKGKHISFIDDFYKSGAAIKVRGSLYPYHKLEYHTSWDWLMPVVEKIERMEYAVDNCHYKKYTVIKCCIFPKQNIKGVSIEKISNTKILSFWLAVVEFVKWYNEQIQDNGNY